jgi:uracil-DNA glycosylase family 4
MAQSPLIFDPECSDCPRLARFRNEVRAKHPTYYAKPVPSFGPMRAPVLIVGLAPGMHGANRTGRPFTGDYAGILLYETLHRFGFANQAGSDDPNDGLKLIGCRITNSVKCLPPENKPEPAEVRRCNRYLSAELAAMRPRVVMALGRIAHEAVLRARELPLSGHPFAHGAEHDLPGGPKLFDSYHCSRYNTQTRRLTPEMFAEVVQRIAKCVRGSGTPSRLL